MTRVQIPDLKTLRSDMGDGGWSLHAPDDDDCVVPSYVVLASGPGRLVRGEWAAPSQRAYQRARATYRRQYILRA